MQPVTSVPASSRPIAARVLRVLRCPVCGERLAEASGGLRCERGHAFDRARQGYVSLRRGRPTPQNADTAAMVTAREELLASGVYVPVRDALADAVEAAVGRESGDGGLEPLVVDLAGGTGWYLAGVLERLRHAHGLGVDLSTPALRRAARAHPRAVAVGADLRERWPLADDACDVVLSVFGPRSAEETARVLAPGGALVVVTPRPQHLAELVDLLGMVAVDAAKEERLSRSLPGFDRVAAQDVTAQTAFDRHLARAAAAMGPSAHHVSTDQLDERVARLHDVTAATVAVTVSTWTPAPGAGLPGPCRRAPSQPPGDGRRRPPP